eukprot:1250989-Pleurochrysis_carterae.AAC.1
MCQPGGRWAGVEATGAVAGVAIVPATLASGDAPLRRAHSSCRYVVSLGYLPAARWCAHMRVRIYCHRLRARILLSKIAPRVLFYSNKCTMAHEDIVNTSAIS